MIKNIIFVLFSSALISFSAELNLFNLSNCSWTANDKPVKVPHSFTYLTPVGSVTNTIRSSHCSYKTCLPASFSISNSKYYYLKLDGVGRCAKVFLNGEYLGIHDFGFLPKYFDITKKLSLTNNIEIVVYQNEKDAGIRQRVPISGDFHVFAGLYRNVWIIESDKPRIQYPENLAKPVLTYKDGFFWDAFGNKVFLKGVNYHQYFGYDWTYDENKERRDLMLIKEMGANAIRTSHYPKSPRFYELCNELGLYVITEVPLVNQIWNTTEDEKLYLEYLEALIKEYGQYECIISWGLYNELTGNQNTNLITKAQALAHKLDPNRPTYGANMCPSAFASIPDILGVNMYWNWYGATHPFNSWISYATKTINSYNKIGSFYVTEYGGSANINQHSSDKIPEEWYKKLKLITDKNGKIYYQPLDPNSNPFQPADYQLFLHESIWNSIKETLNKPDYLKTIEESYFTDHCGGIFIWQMFDTPTPQRKEGSTTNINLKGIMDINRKPKPSYDFYKKAWN